MALELETEIMEEIGLGGHYNFYNGSGSCGGIRRSAAKKLSVVIDEHYKKGAQIAQHDVRLCSILSDIATFGDSGEYVLTKTWEAASDIIATHIHQAQAKPEDREERFRIVEEHLKNRYLGSRERTNLMFW